MTSYDPDVVFVSETRIKQEALGSQGDSETERLRRLLIEKECEFDRLKDRHETLLCSKRAEHENILMTVHSQIGILSGVRSSLIRTLDTFDAEFNRRHDYCSLDSKRARHW